MKFTHPYPNGTRIRKCKSDNTDAHQDGAQGVILSAIGPVLVEQYPDDQYMYFVEWDDMPGLHIGIRQSRVEAIDG